MRITKLEAQLDERDDSEVARSAALATLRWVLGGTLIERTDFLIGFPALPQTLQPLAADFGIRHIEGLATQERARLIAVVQGATIAWMAHRSVVSDIRSAFDRDGIPAVFLKGLALAEQAYPRPAMRLASDVDVWIRPDHFPRAIDALTKRGFTVPRRHGEASDPRGMVPVAHVEARVGGAPVLVELHGRPGSLRDLTDGEVMALWESRMPVGPSGLLALPLEAQLLHVCLHTARSHAFVGGLKALVDIAMIASALADDTRWEAFASRAATARAEHTAFVCLELARELLGAPIPPWVLERVDVGGAEGILDQARALLWSREPKLPSGMIKLVGGLREPGWVRNRLLLRLRITESERRRVTRAGRPAAGLIVRYFVRRVASLARVIMSGDAFRPSLWRRVGTERRRSRLLRNLARVEARQVESTSIKT